MTMKKIGIFYGSTTGYTADLASKVAKALDVDSKDVYDVATVAPSKLGEYDVILLGSSTWGSGELQDNFADFINGIEELYLPGKAIAIFGCGDETMSTTFGAALGEIYKRMQKTGANFIAPFNTDGYNYQDSPAVVDGKCIGLLIDEINHADLTEAKIKAWTDEITEAIK